MYIYIHGMYASFIHQCIHGIHSANKLETKHELIFLFIVYIHTHIYHAVVQFLVVWQYQYKILF